VVGESGVGKSTLLNCIAALDGIDAGSVRILDVDIAKLDEARQAHLRRERLGFVFQAFHVLPHLSVADNVALPLLLQRRPDAGAHPRGPRRGRPRRLRRPTAADPVGRAVAGASRSRARWSIGRR
jgi:ABC-type lipoprotein export system ATPase subunit